MSAEPIETGDEPECDHPNGFGPNGCACGASRPADDDAPTEGLAVTGTPAVPLSPDLFADQSGAHRMSFTGAVNHLVSEAHMPPGVEQLRRTTPETATPTYDGVSRDLGAPGGPLGPGSAYQAPGVALGPTGVPTPEEVQAAVAEFSRRHGDWLTHMKEHLTETPTVDPDFEDWWSDLVADLAPMIGAKAKEYGSNSLAEMGRLYARGQGREVDTPEALAIGCYVYAYGKMQRVADSMIRGAEPSEDTLKDTMIYMAMAMFIRQYKHWP
jgi:hypothetical protein